MLLRRTERSDVAVTLVFGRRLRIEFQEYRCPLECGAVYSEMVIEVSEEHTASIVRSENEVSKSLRYTGNNLPDNTVSFHRTNIHGH
jgi:hypothetical protein